MATRRANTAPEFGNDWAFIEEESEGSIETRKDSVVYRKPTYSEIVSGLEPTETNDGNESEPEFEILTGFQFHQGLPSQEASDEDGDADEGIMIISNHFNVEALDDTEPDASADDVKSLSNATNEVTTSSDSFVSLSGWNALVGLTSSGAGTFSDSEWQDLADEESSPENDELRAMPFSTEETLPFGDECQKVPSPDGSAIWNDLKSLTESTESSEPPPEDNGRDHPNEMDELPGYGCDIKEILNDVKKETSSKGNSVHFKSQPGISADFFKRPFTIDGQKEYLTMTVSGRFHTLPCDDHDDDKDDDAPLSEEGSSIEFIDPTDSSDESFVAIDGQVTSDDGDLQTPNDDDDENPHGDNDKHGGWNELPFMTTSGTLSFNDHITVSDVESDIECIRENDANESSESSIVAVDASDDVLDAASLTSSLSASSCVSYTEDDDSTDDGIDDDIDDDDESDSDDESVLFPSWLEDDTHTVDAPSDEQEDSTSHLYVDVPTFVILLFLTTALGFSIGHGISMYLGNQALNKVAKLQRPGSISSPSPGPRQDSSLTAEEEARIEIWKLEEKLYKQIEDQDVKKSSLKSVHGSLQEKYLKLLNNNKNIKQRLQMSKVMSWYWRIKYDEEKRRKANSSSAMEEWKSIYAAKKTSTERHKTTPIGNVRSFRDIYNRGENSNNIVDRKRSFFKDDISPTAVFKKYEIVSSSIPPRRLGWSNFKMRWTKSSGGSKVSHCSAYHVKSNSHLKPTFHRQPSRKSDKVKVARHGKDKVAKSAEKESTPGAFICLNVESPTCLKTDKASPLIPPPKKLNKKKGDTALKIPLVKPCVTKTDQMKSHMAPCFEKPKSRAVIQKRKTHVGQLMNNTIVKPSKGETTKRANPKQEQVRKELMKRREIRRKQRELNMQANELKLIIAELRRERRLAEKEKQQLQKSRRSLKNQQAEFDGERRKLEDEIKKKTRRTFEFLNKEEKRLRKWKKDEEILFHVSLLQIKKESEREKARLDKQRSREVLNMKKNLKLEKRTLREKKKDLKELEKDYRKERRKFVKIQARKKKVVEKLNEKLETLSTQKKSKTKEHERRHRKQQRRNTRNNNSTKNDIQRLRLKKRKLQNRARKKWKDKQQRFWSDLEKRLSDWGRSSNNSKPMSRKDAGRKRRNKTQKDFKQWQEKLKRLVRKEWKAMKQRYRKAKRERRKNMRVHRKGPWEDAIVQKILQEQQKYDNLRRRQTPGDKTKRRADSRQSIQSEEKRTENWRKNKEKRGRGLVDEYVKMTRKRRRKEKRKYERELERLHQWALQMNEKKLEHERLYKEKRKRNLKCPKVKKKYKDKGRKSAQKSRKRTEIIQVNNTTVMIELRPRTVSEEQQQKSKKKPSLPIKKINIERNEAQLSDLDGTVILSKIDSTSDNEEGMKPTDEEETTVHEHHQQPFPPELRPDLYREYPSLELLGGQQWEEGAIPKPSSPEESPCRTPPQMMPRPAPPPEFQETADHNDRDAAWYVRRAVERDMLRKLNPLATWFPPHDFLKSDGSWFIRRASVREEQRIHPPWHAPRTHKGRTKRKRRRVKKDGTWFFGRAHDRSEQRYNSEPWYMRRAAGRKSDRSENVDNWWLERGYHRDELPSCYNEEEDYDDVSWFPWRSRKRRRKGYPCY